MPKYWSQEELDDGALRYPANQTGTHSYADMLAAWRARSESAADFVEALAEVPFDAFLWETPPVTDRTLEQRFEFVVTDCPALAHYPDPRPFREQFDRDSNAPVCFGNLGGDAALVAPGPAAAPASSAHLGAFSRGAPMAAQLALWQAVAEAMRSRIGAAPIWLSTSGLGVAWLHVRLDSTPKYYEHAPYRASNRDCPD